MELILASLLLSLSTNLDNLAVGVAYGLRNITITVLANLFIAILSGLSTFVAMSFGVTISQFLSTQSAAALGSLILLGIGIFSLWETLTSQDEIPLNLSHQPNHMSVHQALLLGLGLTITNLGTGVGAGLAQLDLVLTSFFSFISSLITIGGGYLIGKILTSNLSSHGLGLISGSLLILLGIINLSHLEG